MGNPLLERAPPEEFAKRNQVIELVEKIDYFERLSGIIEEDFSALCQDDRPADWRTLPVTIRLRFGWADARQRMPFVAGRVAAQVPAMCQRCLRALALDLDVAIRHLLCSQNRTAATQVDYEVWELEEDTLRPLDIVEEALIMALPMVAMHESGTACGAPAATVADEDDSKVRPFADLKSQMRNDE